MQGIMVGYKVTIFKGDGCNTDVLFKSFVQKFHRFFKLQKASFSIWHFNMNYTETTTEAVVDPEL